MWVGEHQQDDELSCHPDLGLRFALSQNLSTRQQTARVSRRGTGEDSVSMMSQRPGISDETNGSSQSTLTIEDVWTVECTVGHTVTCYSFHNGMFSMLFGGRLGICLFSVFYFGGRLQWPRVDMRGWGDESDWD